MSNKFLTDTICFAMKTLPNVYFSNIIGNRPSWKLISKHDLTCTLPLTTWCYII